MSKVSTPVGGLILGIAGVVTVAVVAAAWSDKTNHQPKPTPSRTTMQTAEQKPIDKEAIDCEDLDGVGYDAPCITYDEGKWVESSGCDQARNNCHYRSIEVVLKIDPAADGNTWYVYRPIAE
jgi:hypothetical protein